MENKSLPVHVHGEREIPVRTLIRNVCFLCLPAVWAIFVEDPAVGVFHKQCGFSRPSAVMHECSTRASTFRKAALK
jgi:hypothetical protein